jgi:hypothetical protein
MGNMLRVCGLYTRNLLRWTVIGQQVGCTRPAGSFLRVILNISTMAFAVAQKNALRAGLCSRRSVAVVGRPARSLVIRAASEPKVHFTPPAIACASAAGLRVAGISTLVLVGVPS